SWNRSVWIDDVMAELVERGLAYSGGIGFFFQAEDGIRDLIVTGVQTCALPISLNVSHGRFPFGCSLADVNRSRKPNNGGFAEHRSEERRVGKEGRSRGSRQPWREKRQNGNRKEAAAAMLHRTCAVQLEQHDDTA